MLIFIIIKSDVFCLIENKIKNEITNKQQQAGWYFLYLSPHFNQKLKIKTINLKITKISSFKNIFFLKFK